MSTITIVELPRSVWYLYDQPHPWLIGYLWDGPEPTYRVDWAYNPETGESILPPGWVENDGYAMREGGEE